jgi:hypothetical protein
MFARKVQLFRYWLTANGKPLTPSSGTPNAKRQTRTLPSIDGLDRGVEVGGGGVVLVQEWLAGK